LAWLDSQTKSPRNALGDATLCRNPRTIGDLDMPNDTDLASHLYVLSYARASRNSGLGGHDRMLSDNNVVCNLDKIVDFTPC
jgi:hypothetical protein